MAVRILIKMMKHTKVAAAATGAMAATPLANNNNWG
jgi:hypothetical protein